MVFLCHNSADKALVREINRLLRGAGIATWVDEDDIPAGVKWYEYIFDHLHEARAVVVFLGPRGLGRYQEEELESILRRAAGADTRIVPVLLPGFHEEAPKIPAWVRAQLVEKWNYVDLSLGGEGGLRKLLRALGDDSQVGINDAVVSEVAGHLPESVRARQGETSFRIIWVILHVIGFLGVTAFIQLEGAFSFRLIGVVTVTATVLAGLTLVGWQQLRLRKIQPEVLGAWSGGGLALLLSFLAVGATGETSLLSTIGAFASNIGTAVIAGAVGGWIVGTAAALLSSVGVFTAALLAPTIAVPSPGNDSEAHFVNFFAPVLGTVLWAILIGHLLLLAMRKYRKLRSITDRGA